MEHSTSAEEKPQILHYAFEIKRGIFQGGSLMPLLFA
jgi:hypothetical protein